MITKSILYDLIAAKIWSLVSFIGDNPSDAFIQKVVEQYFSLVQEGAYEDGMIFSLDGEGICLHTISENVLLIGVCDDQTTSSESVEDLSKLAIVFGMVIQNEGAREASKSFPTYAGRTLRKDVVIHFIADHPSDDRNSSGTALERLLRYVSAEDQEVSMPVFIGPYNVRVARVSIGDAIKNNFRIALDEADAVVLILGNPIPDETLVHEFIRNIRMRKVSQILIIPGSDDELKTAQSYESQLNLELCDSVSVKPSYLLLSVLATIGKADVHPELASKTWNIEPEIDKFTGRRNVASKSEVLGHQAFFVVDKFNGEAIFTYYYKSKTEVNERIPNVVAAITSFRLGVSEDAQTSVIQVGELVYALIEFEDLIFTLITGRTDDVEGIRMQFSFLPDLWKDEAVSEMECTDDPYTSPPFTLKLLATLPPEEFLSRMQPSRVKEPDWEKFQSRQVRDFLQAVWGSLDGTLEMSRLVSGSGPQMTLGAIHFLKAMGCIEMKVTVKPYDVPILISPVDEEVRGLYSHTDAITSMMYDNRTVQDISKATGIDLNVLNTVILELYNRGIIKFKD